MTVTGISRLGFGGTMDERGTNSPVTLLQTVGRVGLGGEGVLRTFGKGNEANAVIREAFARGITYWDSAHAYAGSEAYYGSFWQEHKSDRRRIFQTSKSARRNRKGAQKELQETLSRMRISYLDLWQIHDLRTQEDLRTIEEPGGALEAFVDAKEKGYIMSLGVTGHHDPEILLYAVEHWPVDTVLLPVNPVEKIVGGFLDTVIPAARKHGIAVIGMKVLGASHYLDSKEGVSADRLIRFALGEDIDVAIVGCSSPEEVRVLAESGRAESLSVAEREQVLERFRPQADRLAFYRGNI